MFLDKLEYADKAKLRKTDFFTCCYMNEKGKTQYIQRLRERYLTLIVNIF